MAPRVHLRTIRRILVGLDGSGPSLAALEAAATLAAMSCGAASFLSFKWPHFLGST